MTDILELIQQKCPNGVSRVAVKDLGQFEHGVGLDKSMLRSEGDIPVIHYGEIYTTYNLKTDKTVSFLDAGTPVSVSAHHGDVVVCLTDTANLGFVGKAQICGVDVAISGDAGVLHLNVDEADAVFVSHIMNTSWFQSQKEKCKRDDCDASRGFALAENQNSPPSPPRPARNRCHSGQVRFVLQQHDRRAGRGAGDKKKAVSVLGGASSYGR